MSDRVSSSTIQDIAAQYIAKGWQVVPLVPKDKAAYGDDWQKIVFKPEDFRDNDNIGIRSVGGIVDIDCDADEAVAAAAAFLPPTTACFGRGGQPRHWLYKSKFEKTQVYKDFGQADKKKQTLIEIRVNHQSMAPPSIHPNGETVEWVNGVMGEPSAIDPEPLQRLVQLASTCALLARYYNPPGDRHDWGLAISGTFRSIGLTEEETIKVFIKAAEIVGDTEIKDRIGTVRGTYNRGDDEPTKGSGALKDAMMKGKEFLASLRKIWGISGRSFIVDDKERIVRDSQENIARALEKLEITVSYDTFNQKPIVKYNGYHGPLEDRIRNRMWLDIDRTYHFRPSADFFDVVVQDLADKNRMHPVREYLKKLVWDGTPRIDTWLIRAGNAADTPFVRTVSAIVLIAAVRRVMHPGCKFDELLVLESGQGELKSSVLRALCPDEEWFSDDLPLNVDSKQIIERTTGKWIIEAQELSGMRKSQREHLKSMLSRMVDGPVRMAYDRLARTQPRQFIVIGTTNDHHYLTDPTGNRRFWPIRVKRFNLNLVFEERDQWWAEAAAREANGESIRLPQELWDHAAFQQERRRQVDPWEEKIEMNFDQDVCRVTTEDIWECLAMSVEKRTEIAQQRVTAIMQKLGFRRMTVQGKGGKKVKGWGRGNKKIGDLTPFYSATEEPPDPPQEDDM